MNQTTIAIDPNACTSDGLCANVCPSRIFRAERTGPTRVVDPELCCLCGQCLAICPNGAISHSRLDPATFEALDWKEAGGDELLDLVRSRRSVRAYRKREVPRELLERVARSAGYAPTGAFGGAGWVRRVVVVSGEATMRRTAELTAAYMRRLGAVLDGLMVRTVARFSAEARAGRSTLPDLRMRLERWEAGENAITYDAPAAFFVHTDHGTATPHEDCDAAMMNILLSCHGLGLGACWNGWLGHAATGAHVRGFTELNELLGLPDADRVVEAATVGWPRLRLHSLPARETEVGWVGD